MSASWQGHHQRMDHEGLARNALLAQVAGGSEVESLAECGQVFVGPQRMHAALQLRVKRADWISHGSLRFPLTAAWAWLAGTAGISTAWVESVIPNTSVTDGVK